ncbi:hypothetical protein PR048_008873, partial [Dryococelus australis]
MFKQHTGFRGLLYIRWCMDAMDWTEEVEQVNNLPSNSEGRIDVCVRVCVCGGCRETTLLYSSKWTKTTAGQQESATIAAHELAHQWFGNLVTPYWWSNIWLSEGLAQFFAYWALDKAESSWRMMEQFVVSQLQPMLKADASATVDALDSECATPAEIDHKFGLVSYAKGASVTRMIQHVLTEETFRKGIHDYLVS